MKNLNFAVVVAQTARTCMSLAEAREGQGASGAGNSLSRIKEEKKKLGRNNMVVLQLVPLK